MHTIRAKVATISVLLIGIYIFISMVCHDDIANGLKCGLFFETCILFPGLVITLLLFSKSGDIRINVIELFVYAYCIGQVISILAYILVMLNLDIRYIYLFFILASLFLFLVGIHKGVLEHLILQIECNHSGIYIVSIVALVIFLITFFIISCNYMVPVNVGNSFYQDYLYGIGNTIELSMEYPPVNFRAIFQGNYSYHYLYNLQLAVMKRMTGMDAFTMTTYYTGIQSALFLAGAAYLFVSKIIKKPKWIFITLLFILFSTGNEDFTIVTYIPHIFSVPNNLDISYANMFCCLAVMLRQMEKEKIVPVYYVMAAVCFGMSLGCKAPFACIGLVAVGILGLYYIYQKKAVTSSVLYIIIFAVILGGLYFTILRENASINLKIGSSSEAGSNIFYYWVRMGQISRLAESIIPCRLIREIILTIVDCFISNYPAYLLLMIAAVLNITAKKIDIIDIMLLCSAAAGIFLVRYISHFGGSQIYFLFASYSYAIVYGIRGIERKEEQTADIKKKIGFVVLTGGLFLIGFCNFWLKTGTHTYASLEKGVKRAMGDYDMVEYLDHHSWAANYLTPKEYEAYVWLREHTDQEDVIITNMCIAGYTRYSYSAGVFSERHIYVPLNEDLDIIEKCYEGNTDVLNGVQREHNVKYLVQVKRITSELSLPESYAQRAFENDDVIIYELLGIKESVPATDLEKQTARWESYGY